MAPASIKKSFLWTFLGFLTATALVAIVAVLGGEFGETQFKILATTFTISAASILSMACAAFMEKRKMRELGLLGIASAAIAATGVIAGVWLEIHGDFYWKGTVTLIVFAAWAAYSFLLLLPSLERDYQWVQVAGCVSVGILALQILGAIWGEIDEEIYYRILTVVSIVAVLFTLIIPVLMKMGRGVPGTAAPSKLVLHPNADGTYHNDAGAVYEVKIIHHGSGAEG